MTYLIFEFETTIKEIKEKLGEPTSVSDETYETGNKTQYEWCLTTPSGNKFYIYDYKMYDKIEEEENVSWHVGGTDQTYNDIRNYLIQVGLIKTLPF